MAKLDRLTGPALPRVIEVVGDEPVEAAVERFVARHGRAPSSCIIVPARATEDELPECEAAWADQQRRLIAAAKSQPKKEEANVERHARIRTVVNARSGDGLHTGDRTRNPIGRLVRSR
jgi:hypothetical protein